MSCCVQVLVSASPFNIMARWMTGVYRQQRQTRHFILQKPSSCEKNREPCKTCHAHPLYWHNDKDPIWDGSWSPTGKIGDEFLVGGAITILKNMKVNGKDDIPYIMENKSSKPPIMFLFVFVSNENFLTRQYSILPDCVCFSLLCASLTCSQHPSIATHLPQNLIASQHRSHAQLTLSASPFNIMARWMTGVYRQQRQTRHFILQKPSSCEKNQEPCNSHAGQHHTNNKLVFWLAFAGLVFEHVICNNCGCPAKTHSLFTEKCSEILSSNQAFQHVQVLVSASPFNIMARWMTGIYRQQRQTRHFILQKPSSCEND